MTNYCDLVFTSGDGTMDSLLPTSPSVPTTPLADGVAMTPLISSSTPVLVEEVDTLSKDTTTVGKFESDLGLKAGTKRWEQFRAELERQGESKLVPGYVVTTSAKVLERHNAALFAAAQRSLAGREA